MANMLNCDIAISEFKFQWYYYIHFGTNIFGIDNNPFIPTSYGLNSTVLLQDH